MEVKVSKLPNLNTINIVKAKYMLERSCILPHQIKLKVAELVIFNLYSNIDFTY